MPGLSPKIQTQHLLSACSQAKARDNRESFPRNIPSVTLVLGGAPGDISAPPWGTHPPPVRLWLGQGHQGGPWVPQEWLWTHKGCTELPTGGTGVAQGQDRVAQGWHWITQSLH